MKKTFLYVVSAMIGICAAIMIHLSFMVVEAKGTKMLPTIEPEQNVLVCLYDKEVDTGDVVACKSPFYTLDGEGSVILRRIKDVQGDELVLTCDMELIDAQEMSVSREEILGKVVLTNIH